MRTISIAIGIVLSASLSSPALGAQVAPPGNSGVNQYSETLPGAGGDQPSSGSGKGTAGNEGSSLSQKAQRALQAKGPIGEAVADLAARTAPHVGSNAKGRSPDAAKSSGGDSALGTGVGQLAGSDTSGIGIGLPIIMLLSLIGAIALSVLRRRNEEGQTQ